jgi:hypothetical protein
VTARALPGASPRRERLERERTASRLRRQARLESEVVEQLEPLLGPAGRPVGETAMAHWRRRRVEAYLALPPLARARRTWISWGPLRRAATVLALAPLWTVVCLPLRMLSLASLDASHAGVAAIAVAAPVAAFVPPRSRGRFADPLPEPGPPWRGSRAARAATRAIGGLAVVALLSVGLLAALGPGPAAPPEGRMTPAARSADVMLVQGVVAAACGPAAVATVRPASAGGYTADIAGGGTARVTIDAGTGFAAGRHAEATGGAIPCPAP